MKNKIKTFNKKFECFENFNKKQGIIFFSKEAGDGDEFDLFATSIRCVNEIANVKCECDSYTCVYKKYPNYSVLVKLKCQGKCYDHIEFDIFKD